jgi:hypothetical protein
VIVAFVDEARPSSRCITRLGELHKKWADKGVSIVRVYEGPAASEAIAHASPTPAAVVKPGLVPGGYCEAYENYGVRATPTVFMIDRSGILRFADVAVDAIESHLANMLKQ